MRYDFEYEHVISETSQSGVYLKAWLEVTRRESIIAADAVFVKDARIFRLLY